MAEQKSGLVLQWITLIVAVLLLLGSFTWMMAPSIKVPTAKEIAAEIKLPEAPEVPVVDLTGVETRLTDIETTLNEEEQWEDEAEALATAEWEDRDYKDIFKFLEDKKGDIDDKEDIVYVREDKKTTFEDMDADDKDAEVTQYVTVKYENDVGKNIKRDLTIITIIEDGEVEDQKISIT